MKEVKKIALVLSGGGFKGSFQLGVINYLNAHWEEFFPAVPHMEFDIIAGISAGSLNGVMLSANKLPELNYIWKNVGLHGASEIFINKYLTENKEAEDKLTVDIQAIRDEFFPEFTTQIGYTEGLKLMASKKERENFLYQMGMEIFNEFKKNFDHHKISIILFDVILFKEFKYISHV